MADYTHTPLSSYRVRPHRPWRTALWVTFLLIAAVAGSLFAYELGVRHGGYDKYQARAVETRLRMQRDELRERVNEMVDSTTRLRRSAHLDETTIARLERLLQEREQAMGRLEEELSFYQSLVSPAGDEDGLSVERFSLMEEREGRYAFELVLTRLNRDDSQAEGHVDLTLDAVHGSEEVRVSLNELMPESEGESEPPLSFRFKYFQRLHGTIELPDHLEPVQLTLRVESTDAESIETLYSWGSLISGGT